MSKDATTLTDTPALQMNNTTQATSMDSFGNILLAPVRKLDADEYTANDLDGVTESATGSGNLNFLMMQAGQTDEAINNLNPFHTGYGDNLYLGGPGASGLQFTSPPVTDNRFDTAMDRGFGSADTPDTLSGLTNTGNTSTNAGSLGASNLAANTAIANPLSSVTNFASSGASETNSPPIPPANGLNGANGSDGDGGTDGTNGTNGADGDNGTGTTIIDNTTTLVDNTVTNLGDTIDNAVTNLGDVVNNTTTNLFDTINNTTNNLTDIINNIINNGGGGGLGPIGLNLDLTIDSLTNLTLDIINGDTITNILNETLNTAPILDPLTGLIGNLMSNTSLNLLINPFQPDTNPNDTDLHVGVDLALLGLQVPNLGIDLPLDVAEGLLGDIDLDLDLTNDLLGLSLLDPVLDPLLGGGGGNGDTDLALGGLGGLLDAAQVNAVAETILNPLENLVGDLDLGGAIGLDLLGLDSGQTGPDTDISIPLDIALIDSPLLNDGLNISLDPLENIVGDIDLDLGVAGNILGDIAPNLFDTVEGGNGDNNLLSQIGDGLAGLAGDLLPAGDGADTDIALDTGIGLLDNALADNTLGLILDPVEDLVGDLDIGGAIGLDLLGTADDSAADTDLTIPVDLGFIDSPLLADTLDIPLDPLENIVGDIDLDLGVAGNILGDVAGPLFDTAEGGSGESGLLTLAGDGLSDIAGSLLPVGDSADTDLSVATGIDILEAGPVANGLDIILDPVEDLAGDLDIGADIGLGLLGTADDNGGDTDLSIPLDIALIDNPLVGETIDLSLDPLENIVGDIDLDLGVGGNILGDVAGPLFDTAEGGSGENGLPGLTGDGLSDLLSPVADGAAAILDDNPFGNLDDLVGDIDEALDTTLDGALGLLDAATPNTGGLDLGGLTDTLAGGGDGDALSGLTSWTESILPGAGDLLGGGLASDPVSSIPDPVLTSPVLSLPPVPVVTSLPVVGGLFGGNHHGGLFG